MEYSDKLEVAKKAMMCGNTGIDAARLGLLNCRIQLGDDPVEAAIKILEQSVKNMESIETFEEASNAVGLILA